MEKAYDLTPVFNKVKKMSDLHNDIGVLNGIAHLSDDIFYISGKNWPLIFKIQMK